MNNEEKYFAAILGVNGGIELIEWFTTKKEARQTAKHWRKMESKDSERRQDVFHGKVLAT